MDQVSTRKIFMILGRQAVDERAGLEVDACRGRVGVVAMLFSIIVRRNESGENYWKVYQQEQEEGDADREEGLHKSGADARISAV